MVDVLLNRYDLYYIASDGTTKMGLMLAKGRDGTKLWSRSDSSGLPDSYAPGDIGYANISPDIQKVIAQEYLIGGLGAIKHEASEEEAFNAMRYLKSEDIDLRCKGKAYPGPKVSAIANPTHTASAWNQAKNYADPDSAWTEEANAIDGSDATKATNTITDKYLYLHIPPISCSKIEYYWTEAVDNCVTDLEIGVYYEDAWHVVVSDDSQGEGALAEASLGATKTVTKARVKFTRSDLAYLHVLEFYAESAPMLGVVNHLAEFNDKVYAALSNTLIVKDAGGTLWTVVHSFAETITDLKAFGEYLYIALAKANKYWYMDTTAVPVFVESTTGEADLFCKVGTNFYKLKLPNSIQKATLADPTNTGGWDTAVTVGETAQNVNDLIEHDAVLYCMKENGPYYISAAGVAYQPFPELNSISHTDSGKNSVVAFAKLYFRMGNLQEREVDSGVLSEITPSAFAPGIADYAYAIVARAQDDDWLYELMYRGVNDVALLAGRWEYVAGRARWIWHDIRKLIDITNASCALVSSVEGRPYLYISSTVAGEDALKVYLSIGNDATADADYRFCSLIDVGNTAIDRATNMAAVYTYIDLANPANDSGYITSVEVWAQSYMAAGLTGLRVGSFYLVSGTDYKCRDSVAIGDVTAGSKQTFSGLSIAVEAGDFIGCYFATGLIESANSGGSGVMYVSGEYIDPDDQTTYTAAAGYAISLYATGVKVNSLWTPRYTTLLTAFTKKWVELFAQSKNLSSTKKITTYYSTDDGTTFTSLGVLNTSPEQTLTYPSGIEKAMMNLKLVFTSDSESTVPVLEYFNLKAMTIVPSVARFQHSIKCDSNLLLKEGHKSDVKQSAIITFVDSLRDSICTLGDPFGNEHSVRVRVAGEREVFDEDTKKPVLVYNIEAVKL